MTRPPRVHVAPSARHSYGDIAGKLAADYDLLPDDWQQFVLDDWLAYSMRGKYASLTCGLACPRQNGKNGIIEMRELFGMVGRGERFLHTAHEVKTARKAFRRLQHFFGYRVNDPAAAYPELNALVAEIRNVNGQEAIRLRNGGSVEIVARSKGSGRGYTVDVLVIDEAQEMSEEDLEALMPTTSSAPLGNPQWILTGTPPGPKVNGEVFTRTRLEALSGHARRLCWHEWSCDGAIDLDDHEQWRQANPALGGRLQFDVVEGERSRFSDDGFARERLGMWAGAASLAVVDAESWASVADASSVALDRLALGLDVDPDRTVASVALAGQRADGLWHVELDEQRKGVGWLVPYVQQLLAANPNVRAVVIDKASPAASLIDALGSERVRTTTTTSREYASACGQFFDGVHEQWLHHIDQPQMNAALAAARKRPLGDAWAWNRKNAASDITPVVAATLALWGAQASKVKRPARKPRSDRKVVMLR